MSTLIQRVGKVTYAVQGETKYRGSANVSRSSNGAVANFIKGMRQGIAEENGIWKSRTAGGRNHKSTKPAMAMGVGEMLG